MTDIPMYKIEDKVTLIVDSEFGDQFSEWGSSYATVVDTEWGTHNYKKIVWCSVKSPSGYTNAYPQKDLLPYFSHDLVITNKQARILLEE